MGVPVVGSLLRFPLAVGDDALCEVRTITQSQVGCAISKGGLSVTRAPIRLPYLVSDEIVGPFTILAMSMRLMNAFLQGQCQAND